MPSLKDLKNRIESVKSTRKITKAMQMVAAAKLRRAQEAAEAGRPYAERMQAVMGGLAASVGGSDSAPRLLAGTGSDQTHLLVVMTSERGLCGGFNSTIVRLVRTKIAELLAQGKTVKILTVGKKGREQLRRDYAELMIGHVDLSEVKRVGYANAAEIAGDILRRFDGGEFDVAKIYFNQFQSVISQIPTETQIIPAKFDAPEADDASTLYDYEPSEEAILEDLLPRGVATQIFSALLENGASEQGARMSAMDNATRNAGDMIDRLTIQFNRSRQAVITNELIEIISGAEAL
ncbi:F0F1 ATP synthase subunit gamma [Nioella sp.]|jgi:F-type H+-transporting ATPase subunit gamma|uniref:F0F1 ATP synthase subunit gamma n=1 Tax=Nioella sp. TaxID=1912091 RepID=UPI003513597A